MPNFKGHLCGGLVAYGLLLFVLGSSQNSFLEHSTQLSATLAGALFPDIDIKSKGQRLYMKVLALVLFISLFMQAYIPLLFVLVLFLGALIIPHRGLFHDLWFITSVVILVDICLLIALPSRANEVLAMSAFFLVGVLSHLVLDKGIRKALT